MVLEQMVGQDKWSTSRFSTVIISHPLPAYTEHT